MARYLELNGEIFKQDVQAFGNCNANFGISI